MAPKSIQTLFEKATRLAKSGDLNGATKQFRLILKSNPKVVEAHFHLGQIALRQNNPTEAANRFAAALKLRPNAPTILDPYATSLHLLGKDEAALAVYDKLIQLCADQPKPRADKALLLQRLGRFDEAEAEFRTAILNHPLEGQLYRVFLGTKKLKADDALIPLMLEAWASPQLTDLSRMQLGYALAKTMEDTGQFDQVFKYLEPANALLSSKFPYDFKAREAEIATLFKVFQDWQPRSIERATKAETIFITGMPRSGTTLIEQILASHSRVTGGGEMAIALRLAHQSIDFLNGDRLIADLPDKAIADLGHAYIKEAQAKIGAHPVFTDKSIQTYMVMGLMHLAVPNSKFVVVKRDPRDVGLSIYKNYFAAGTHRYSTDLEIIGRYIALYEKVIAFWKARVPDAIIEVGYEDLIADPEAETRRLVAACGLEWEDACLTFHETKREVKTLSLHQVRQPIYASSTKAWQRYETELAPLIKALEEGGCR